ncbi:pirin family protein [Ectobacillus polymachus]|uniref:pirin family protein n=1 Tax=Ectobacillus polymachus TaxID=1508806 RepID=UPI003A8390D5
MKSKVYSPDQQGIGAFDGGKITEQKPIAFPHEYSEVKRVGPLFYWSWAHAEKAGFIPLHPHQAFEIVTYVLQGKSEHGDSLGTNSVIGPGGAQVMQTGSGVYHKEGFVGPNMEGFQIWFEPYINEAIKREPTYNQYKEKEFPVFMQNDIQVKTIIGEGSPIHLEANAQMWDVTVQPGRVYTHSIPSGYSLATLAIRGNGIWKNEKEENESAIFQHKDFIVLEADSKTDVTLIANKDEELRIVIIQVPTQVDYPLYKK